MWEEFLKLIFGAIQALYSIVGDWGMAIIVITVIFRAAITPLMFTQTKSSYRMQKIQPLIQEIRSRFPDDPVRQNQETQKLYAETKFNPLAGCVPMLIQMPIFIALFNVLRGIKDFAGEGAHLTFYNIVPDLTISPADAWGLGFGTFLPYIILLAIFALCTFVPTLLMQKGTQNPAQRRQTLIMVGIMSIMMIWIGWGSPAGVLLFWGASSLIAIAQQQISLRIVKSQDAKSEEKDEYVIKADVVVDRKVKKKRPNKKR